MNNKFYPILLLCTFILFPVSIVFTQNLNLIEENSLPTEKGKILTISTFIGSIEVTTWDKNEVNVKVSGNNRVQEIMTIDINNTPSGITIDGQLKIDEKKKPNKLTIEYKIKVPADYNVDAFTGGGGVTVTGLNGNVKINTSGGNIDVDNIKGSIDGATNGGNITIKKNTGTLDLATQGGNIVVDGFNGKVDISTMGGNIVLNGTGGTISGHTAGGNIKLDFTGKNEGIDLSTMAGNIRLDLPADIDADADISTIVGKIDTDFASANNGQFSSFLKTKFNLGGRDLKCTTSVGNITINKK